MIVMTITAERATPSTLVDDYSTSDYDDLYDAAVNDYIRATERLQVVAEDYPTHYNKLVLNSVAAIQSDATFDAIVAATLSLDHAYHV